VRRFVKTFERRQHQHLGDSDEQDSRGQQDDTATTHAPRLALVSSIGQ
jgi:hypothetical protein